MHQYGLIGYPLGHSFSASFFAEKFKNEGIDARYRNFPLESIQEFKDLVNKETTLLGLNVTVPYKQEVIAFLDSLSPTAKSVQAVNTISFKRHEGHLELVGDNTDLIGFRKSLEQYLKAHHSSALVLGTGGSSKAVIYVLEQLGIKYTMVSRTARDEQIGYGSINDELLSKTKLIINTTPLGMHPREETFPSLPYEALSSNHLLFDLVYNPVKTKFLSLGEEHGAQIVNGHDMLIYQAEASWEIWNTM